MSSSYTNPNNQTLPTPGSPKGTEETDVRNWLTYWQNYLRVFFDDNNRLAGGTGFKSDNLADSSVLANHYKPQRKRINRVLSTNEDFGRLGVVIAQTPITTTFANASIKLNASAVVEATTQNANTLFVVTIEKSTTSSFTSFTKIGESVLSKYYEASSLIFSWATGCASAIDLVPSAGTNYYRLRVSVDRVGVNSAPNNLGGTLIAVNLANFIEYEVTQDPTA